MKHTKKLLSLLLALVLALAMAMPVMAATISMSSEGHKYNVYQIFTADVTADGILSNVKYGQSFGIQGAKVDKSVLENIKTDNDANAYAKSIKGELHNPYQEGITGPFTLNDVPAGYYLIEDVTDLNGANDANSAYMVEVVSGTVNVTPKVSVPEVDKQVYDNNDGETTGDNDGWGETADHQIGEKFQFKLTAKLPADEDFAKYASYKLVFNDTMSAGITFKGIESVKVNGTPITKYSTDGVNDGDKGELTWTLTIEDLLDCGIEDLKLANGVTVEVVYNALLNEEAQVNAPEAGREQTTTNQNKVNLEYSNNPNGEGLGRTPDDTVFVFTYQIPGTKYKNAVGEENEMQGAGFKLKNAGGQWAVVDETTKAVTWTEDKDTGTEFFSDEHGQFVIEGLDVGTYTLVETTTPAGYNTCEEIPIVIAATHLEPKGETEQGQVTASMTVKGGNATNVDVINEEGTTLPETGGIGTTIFYVIGAILVIGAGILLVAKKRTGSEQ